MPTPNKLNEFNHAEDPARILLERLGWIHVPRASLEEDREGEREVLLKERLRAALLRLNEWLTEPRRTGSSSIWKTSTPSAWTATRRSTSI